MKPEDYYSSSDEDATDLVDGDDNRASDDSEYNFTDEDVDESADDDEESADDDEQSADDDEQSADDAEEASEGDEEMEDVEFDDETIDEQPTSTPSDTDQSDNEDGDDESSADDEAATTEDGGAGNASWAKSLAKILKQEKPKSKKSVVLSKAKKLSDILDAREKAKSIGFAIDGEVKEEKPDVDELELEVEAKKKRKQIMSLRIRPTMMDRERERAFKKIATKGVVQLFNAVRTQQKDLVQKLDAAGRLDHKRDAVLNNINKRKFLDVLMGGARAKSENVDNPVKDESDMDEEVYNDGLPKNSIWSVLKYDFVILFWLLPL